MAHWRRDWEQSEANRTREADAARAEAKRQQLEADGGEAVAAVRRELEAEIERLKQQIATAAASFDQAKADDAERQRKADEDTEAKRVARLEHLHNVAGRRLSQLGLARGYSAWVEAWKMQKHITRVMTMGASRLARPQQSAAFASWRLDWESAARAAAARKRERAAEEKAAREIGGVRDHLEAETTKAALSKAATDDERKAYQEKAKALAEEQEAARRAAAQAKKAAEDAEARLDEAAQANREALEKAAADAAARGAATEASMQQMLSEQRATFDEDLASKTKQWQEEREALEAQLAELRGKMMTMKEGKGGGDAAPAPAPKKTPKEKEEEKAKKERKRGSVLGNFDVDEDSDVPVSEQLRQALAKNAGRVIDLFREWDSDQSGEVDRKEFHVAMDRMGLEIPKKDIDELFNTWDPDGGGSIDLKELQKALRSNATTAAPPLKNSLQKAAAANKAVKALSSTAADAKAKKEGGGAEKSGDKTGEKKPAAKDAASKMAEAAKEAKKKKA